jgi:hypothetical protein
VFVAAQITDADAPSVGAHRRGACAITTLLPAGV